VDQPLVDVRQQLLQRRAIHGSAGDAAVIIGGLQQSPTLMGLALDVRLSGLALGMQGVEVLLQPMLRRLPGVDDTTQDPTLRRHGWLPATQRTAVRSTSCR